MNTRETLGYSRSKKFVGPEQFDLLPANELLFALRLAVAACETIEATRFEGAYVLQEGPQSPAVPVVYLISTKSDSAARRLHQLVWNQNQTPFLIIESPSTVRLYSGFKFDRDDSHDHSLRSAVRDVADILEKLAAFKAESIDDGTVWKQWAHAVDPEQRVDEKLLADLRVLDRRLQDKEGMTRAASHGLIGKYVYLSYLRARDILSDKKLAKWEIDPAHVFTKQATLKAFRQVNEQLQSWLNGSVFSLGEDSLKEIKAEQLKLVARVFAGDSPTSVSEIQTALFSVYDFSHIPIETLSCVYEQFLHDVEEADGRTSRGKALGAYYTPLPLADYVLSEMDRRRPLEPGMTVLDPACGSGAFLVQCYRRLVERQRRNVQRNLKATELRDLLTKHVFGIDRDEDACRVAELSLIMTLLDYVEPPDLEHTNFKLPSLCDHNIFQGDFFESQGRAFDFLSQQKFDWVVGNPPWAEVKGTPPVAHEHYAAFGWMQSHRSSHPTSGNQLAEAFLWKVGDHLNTEGICGLVVLAMTWFKKEAKKFRQSFFTSRRVWCLANFANLAYVLFAGRSERPASVVFFEHEAPDGDHVIQTFSPFVAEQLANRPDKAGGRLTTWNIVVSSAEVREIEQNTAALGESLTWKLAMWGTPRDRKLLDRLDRRFAEEKLSSLVSVGINQPRQGFELRKGTADDTSLKPAPELEGKAILDMSQLRQPGRLFSFPAAALRPISKEECYIRIRGGFAGLEASRPPHILVDASRRFAVYSDEFIAVPPRQIGISGNKSSKKHLRALSLFLSSDFCRFHQFFNAPKWGIDESMADHSTLMAIPVPFSRLPDSELDEWSHLLDELVAVTTPDESRLQQHNPSLLKKLNADLNGRVYALLGLRTVERWLVEDFVQLHMELNKGKFSAEASRAPTTEERNVYFTSLRKCLDGFLSSNRGMRHKLEALVNQESALLAVSLVKETASVEPVEFIADDSASGELMKIRDRLRTKHSQWVYFDRNLKVYDTKRGVLYQFKPLQRLHWTRRQAVLDADDIIAESLSGGEAT